MNIVRAPRVQVWEYPDCVQMVLAIMWNGLVSYSPWGGKESDSTEETEHESQVSGWSWMQCH